ncbi:segregation/condensation protein A [Clostridium tetani]|uniref:Segregation and condensation protein A n=1 Tax=Clostridium tetani TaxID=1513 RepID=A0ABY0ELH6_CLOTA|nr:segregation/condensation protein A [Clostridium tetani]CDI49690.1 segregation and condensation protein A [Clostridium tetani 12124569]KHO38949.1 segregation and condensation protein A [Clostridium tetani]RXI38045.1 segregation/condensation protein A [Clostridium tetani]RXI52399.1 segregation/condensation protein A [Clostridium tetani]RXI70038.1 segregation/condensation protein A [Clostridium tetani]
MELQIKIQNFQGPFDLLLHLIKKNQLDIYNINISEITGQYMEYIESLKEMDLEVTSEFIVIAATLLQIKSRELLPKTQDEEEEEISEETSEKILLDKLIEYKKFKNVANYLKGRLEKGFTVFSKKPEIIEKKEEEDKDIFIDVTILELYNLYNELITKYKDKINLSNTIPEEIELEEFKIGDKMDYLKSKIIENKNLSFSKISKECSCKGEVIVTFLALLELIRIKIVKVVQEGNFKEIYLERMKEDEADELYY